MIFVGWFCMAVVMGLLWIMQRRSGNAGIVDVAWGMGVGLLAAFFAFGSPDGDVTRRILIATLTMIWAIRLSGYVLWRVLSMPEDGRYQTLQQNWGPAAQAKMFRFYQFQAFGSLLFALPMLVASQNAARLGLWDYVGCGIWLIAVVGEIVADRQLARFRVDSANKGAVCRTGLWKYSRHPNYFFEWLHWWAYVGFAVGVNWGWTTILAPLAMLYFITRVTGIPPTEAQALKSRGDAYREYQCMTSAFFPWPPRQKRSPA